MQKRLSARQALNFVVSHSGKPKEVISTEMGRTKGFISATTSRGTVPKVDTFAIVADVCGYDLMLKRRDDGRTIIIDPSKQV